MTSPSPIPKRNWPRTLLGLAGLAILGFGIHYIGSSLGFFLADKMAENSMEIVVQDGRQKELVDVFWKSQYSAFRKIVEDGIPLDEPYQDKGPNYFWVVYGSDTIYKFTDEKENEYQGREYTITLSKKPEGGNHVQVKMD